MEMAIEIEITDIDPKIWLEQQANMYHTSPAIVDVDVSFDSMKSFLTGKTKSWSYYYTVDASGVVEVYGIDEGIIDPTAIMNRAGCVMQKGKYLKIHIDDLLKVVPAYLPSRYRKQFLTYGLMSFREIGVQMAKPDEILGFFNNFGVRVTNVPRDFKAAEFCKFFDPKTLKSDTFTEYDYNEVMKGKKIGYGK